MTTIDRQLPRPTLDVSHLKPYAFDSHAPAWWGNVLLMCIETTTVALMVVSYLYLRQNFEDWPPPRTDVYPTYTFPFPDLPFATADAVLVALACGMMYWTDMQARKLRRGATLAGLAVMFVVAAVATYFRFMEFKQVHFRWDDNAYASVVWATLVLHLTYLFTALGEFGVMGAWLLSHDIDHKHALDVTLAGGFWYWVASTWLIIYFTMYWGPRLF